MGASTFSTVQAGLDAKDAFAKAQDRARYIYGHGGYTGTIAEKTEFRMVTKNHKESPDQLMSRLLNDPNWWGQDKWGPAACLRLDTGEYLFFGWASC